MDIKKIQKPADYELKLNQEEYEMLVGIMNIGMEKMNGTVTPMNKFSIFIPPPPSYESDESIHVHLKHIHIDKIEAYHFFERLRKEL